jgi:hypothetical protein
MPADDPIENDVRERQDAAIDALHGVKDALTALAAGMENHPDKEWTEEALAYNRRRGLLTTGIMGLVLIVVLFFLGTPLLINSFANRKIGGTLVGCTSPGKEDPTSDDPFNTGHECYDRSQRRSNQILADAGSLIVAVVSCDRQNIGKSENEFNDCVTKVLAERLRN